MKPHKLFLGLVLVGALGLVLWQLNRSKAVSPAASAPIAHAPAPGSTTRDESATEPPPAAAPVATAPIAPVVAVLPPPAAPVASPAAHVPAGEQSVESVAPGAAMSPAAQAEGLAATARMYAAHAPLRTPEVADPDSAANRRILGTMVAKALAQPAMPPAKPARN